jgi:hypothetical protein
MPDEICAVNGWTIRRRRGPPWRSSIAMSGPFTSRLLWIEAKKGDASTGSARFQCLRHVEHAATLAPTPDAVYGKSCRESGRLPLGFHHERRRIPRLGGHLNRPLESRLDELKISRVTLAE